MTPSERQIQYMVLQFLEEENYLQTMHSLEQELGIYFNMKYFEETILKGSWDEAEGYLSAFTKVDDNEISTKMFYVMRKQKFIDALTRNENLKAWDILENDLYKISNEDVYYMFTSLLLYSNIREQVLPRYSDTKTVRALLWMELRILIQVNSLLRDKIVLPAQPLRLSSLSQSLSSQHTHCLNENPNLETETLPSTEHICETGNVMAYSSPSATSRL